MGFNSGVRESSGGPGNQPNVLGTSLMPPMHDGGCVIFLMYIVASMKHAGYNVMHMVCNNMCVCHTCQDRLEFHK